MASGNHTPFKIDGWVVRCGYLVHQVKQGQAQGASGVDCCGLAGPYYVEAEAYYYFGEPLEEQFRVLELGYFAVEQGRRAFDQEDGVRAG